MKGIADLGEEQRILSPSRRIVDVQLSWDDVEVANEHDRDIQIEQFGRVAREPLQPPELVVELGAGRRVAIRQVQATHQHAVDGRLEKAALIVSGVSRKTAPRLDRLPAARQDCDAIPGLLAMPDRAIAGLLNFLLREAHVRRFQLLQADDVGLRFLHPAQQHRASAR